MGKIGGALSALKRDSPFLITVANFGAMGLALLTAPIVARALGPDGRGETAAVIAVYAVVPILIAAGIPLELRRIAAIGPGSEAIRAARDIWCLALIPSSIVALVLNVTIFSGFSADARLIASIGVALSPLAMSWSADVSVLIARGRYRSVMLIRLIQPVLFFVSAMLLWLVSSLNVSLVIGINIAATLVSCLAGLVLVRVSPFGPRAPYTALFKSGLRYYGSSLAEAASNRLDQILVLPLVGAFGAGLYSVAVTIGTLPLALGHALGASYFRDVAAASTGESRNQAVANGVRATSALTFVGCALLAAATPVLVPLLFGSDFAGAVPITFVILVGSFGLTVGYVCSMMLAAQGQGIRMTVAQVVSLLIAVGLLYGLAPSLGVMGAGLASTIAYLALLIMLMLPLHAPWRALLPTPVGIRTAIHTLFR